MRPRLPTAPPPGPARPGFWRSPIRGPWLTSFVGLLLLPGLAILFATGLLSHAVYQPQLGQNAVVPRDLPLQPLTFAWPTSPSWLYAATQGTHMTLGIALVPLLLLKLWSVIPRLFAWPPAATPAQALERLATLLLVASALFQFVTGITNVQLWYPWGFGFVVAHYYGAWVFVASLVLHLAVKLPTVRRAWRTRQALRPLLDDLARTRPEPFEPGGLVTPNPAAPTISRRGAIGLAGAASGSLLLLTVGQSVGGPLRKIALFAPRGAGAVSPGPNGFPVNKTALVARVSAEMAGAAWRLDLRGAERLSLSRDELLAMELASHELPIACVEGWSTIQRWTGVPLAALAALAGADPDDVLHVASLQPRGAFRQTTLGAHQVAADGALLALRVNGADLSLDHGFPARIIGPGLPGVHCTKWVSGLTFARS
ncbi:molybdopterin-dependent oxidoreductase [Patulibacter defluvii]|uniref:molybdopterin-dependent oxidoreductase n=1 Tax=Patulibacter defluvii TaxID=3095358 RepID=UPI002A757E9F|nr:molybdopterin-dependent oxidoreductase [Patulibacter sp. DM4]